MRRVLASCVAAVLLAGCGSDPVESRPGATGTTATTTAAALPDPVIFEPAPTPEPDDLGSEFDSPADLEGWRVSAGEDPTGTAPAASTATVVDGQLQLVPDRSQWLNRHHGLGVARQVSGDVMVTARVLATGRAAALPTSDWSLTGIMLRAPLTEPGAEEWVHLSVGFVGEPILERKQTVLGNSELSTFGIPAGWVELRLVRSGPSVVLLHRLDGAAWTFTYSYAETRLPDTVELLLTGQTAGLGGEPDLIGHVDWVHVQASPLSPETAAAVAAGTADPDVILAELPD